MEKTNKAFPEGGAGAVSSRGKQILLAAAVSLAVLAMLLSAFSIKSSACQFPVSDSIFSGAYLSCTITSTVNGSSTSTVGATSPYNWGAWVAVLLILAVVMAFWLIRRSAKV